jgi:hypothetical protein
MKAPRVVMPNVNGAEVGRRAEEALGLSGAAV